MARAKGRAKKAAGKAKKAARRGPREACAECKKNCKAMYEKLKKELEDAKPNMDKSKQANADEFKKHYEANHERYEAVAHETGIPAPLIGAINWRESSGHFNTYLHNGDPLGKPTVNVPKGKFFKKDEWDKAAADALKPFKKCAQEMGMTETTTDRAKMAAFAEHYNGTGYLNHGLGSAYANSGNTLYTTGFYPSDGKWNFDAVDPRPGVVPLVDNITPPDPDP